MNTHNYSTTQVHNTIILLLYHCILVLYALYFCDRCMCVYRIRYEKRKRACIFDGLVICLHRVEHHNKGVKRLRATYLG